MAAPIPFLTSFLLPTALAAGVGFGVNKLMADKAKKKAPSAPVPAAPRQAVAAAPTLADDRHRGAGIAAGASGVRLAPLGRGGGGAAPRTTLLGG